MTELNVELMAGFLFWAIFCLVLFIIDLKTEIAQWKIAANAMECHAGELQKVIDCTPPERLERPWDSIPKGVITHAKKRR